MFFVPINVEISKTEVNESHAAFFFVLFVWIGTNKKVIKLDVVVCVSGLMNYF